MTPRHLTDEPMDPAVARRVRWFYRLGATGRVIFVSLMALLFVVSALLGLAAALDSQEPVYWGTFTEDRCEPSRYGCQSFGTWVSDDRTITKTNIALDGRPDETGTARASFQPTGFANDADWNIVHTDFGSSAEVWMPWAFCLMVLGITVNRVRRWGWRIWSIR